MAQLALSLLGLVVWSWWLSDSLPSQPGTEPTTASVADIRLLGPILFSDDFEGADLSDWNGSGWALFETFDGNPASPSQALLPANFDFAVTHRTHPRDHQPNFAPFPADHGSDCAGPSPDLPAPPQHPVVTRHDTSGRFPDASFFVCKDHMMSAMGDVEGYSVTAFWPRQEFDFSDGGILEFDVNLNDGHARSWWEVLIAPRNSMKIGAAQDWLPIDETYPRERIVFTFSASSSREIQVGSTELAPAGWIAEASDWRQWRYIAPSDPALDDRRIRRPMRIEIDHQRILWRIARSDGSWDDFELELPDGLPFERGLVMFKTHAYTPEKDGNVDQYTYHWDNLRFSGPVVGRYEVFETEELVYLQNNGNRPIGDRQTVTLDLPRTAGTGGRPPTLFGQLHGANAGQVELSINHGEFRQVHPLDYSDDGCTTQGWASFVLPLASDELVVGSNSFEWRVGPRPACLTWQWDGFSVKSLEVQLDL